MLYSLIKTLATSRKAATRPDPESDNVPGVSESTFELMKRQARHARRMAYVKDAELNRLRHSRKMERDAKQGEGKARWQSSTIPLALDSRQQIIRKIDEIEIGMDLHHPSGFPRTLWKDTRPLSIERGSRGPRQQAPAESPYTAAVALISTGRCAAEQILRQLIRAEGNSALAHDTWACLLGLLRATGDRPAFDSAVLDYSQLAGSRAVEFARDLKNPDTSGSPEAGGLWVCPPRLGSSAMDRLKVYLDDEKPPVLNWSRCLGVDATASSRLRDTLALVASDGIARMQDAQPLISALSRQAAMTDAAPIWSLCLLEALRCVHDPERYETVALEYRNRYEVLPPPWRTSLAVTADLATSPSVGRVVLAGDCEEMSVGAFDRLLPGSGGDVDVVLVCDNLVRLDFYSAAALVNWTAARNARGQAVRLTGVHKLLALYLKAIGLYDHASVELGTIAAPGGAQDSVC